MDTRITKSLRYYPPGTREPAGVVSHEAYGSIASCRATFAAVAAALKGTQIETGKPYAAYAAARIVCERLNAAGIECQSTIGRWKR